MLTLMPTLPEVGAHTRTVRTGEPARYTTSRGPGTLVITALAFAVKRSTTQLSTCGGVRPTASRIA